MKTPGLARLAAGFAMIVMTVTIGGSADATPEAEGTINSNTAAERGRGVGDTCDYNFATVNGLTICSSKDGNIMRVDVNGVEHVRNGSVVEGYELCNGSVKVAHDSGGFNGEAGWTDVSSNFSGAKVTVVRNAPGMRLRQDITRNGAERKILVKITLTNIGNDTLSGWRFGRYVDADVDTSQTGSYANAFLSQRRGVEAFRSLTAGAAGGTLKLVNQTQAQVVPSLGNSSGQGLGDCVYGSVASGTAGSDGTMKLTWLIPTLTPSASATTTFVYYTS